MNDKKYPIGTNVRMVNINADYGLDGKLVGYRNGYLLVFLPTATSGYGMCGDIKYTWMCTERDLKVIAIKNQQLLFDFMKE